MAVQIMGRQPMGRKHGDAGLGRHIQQNISDRERPCQRGLQALHHGHGSAGIAVGQQHGKFIPTQARHHGRRRGGMVDAREREALKQVEKLRYDQETAEQLVEQQVRDAWQSLSTAQARLQALSQSEQASTARLTATRQAHRTGARTTNEWLGAEHDAAQAELALLQLRIQTALEQLRLSAASGDLGEAQLRQVNALLK